MTLERISTRKFTFSPEYREGINDALDEIINYQRKLLKEGLVRSNCSKIYDELVNSMYEQVKELAASLGVDDQHFWSIIDYTIYRSYLICIKKMDFAKVIHSQLNDHLKERNIRGKIEPSIRFNVFKRDCFKCVHCGESPATDPKVVLVIDHIQPISKGGKNTPDNFHTLCHYCNAGKGNNY